MREKTRTTAITEKAAVHEGHISDLVSHLNRKAFQILVTHAYVN